MSATNKAMIIAGIATMFQALGQIIFTSIGLLQYFCVIDFLKEVPLLLFIRILYFHNPVPCGNRITIGQNIEGLPSQAMVILNEVPFTAQRTFLVNCVSLGLSAIWFITCIGLMRGGAKDKTTKPIRWPWIIITILICALDITATSIYANDSFHTRTLAESIAFIGASVSGIGNVEINTSWAAWVMVLLYSRFGILFILNLFLVVSVVLHVSGKRAEDISIQVEAPTMVNQAVSVQDDDETSVQSEPVPKIPRPGLSQSFRRMKARLFGKGPTLPVPRATQIEFAGNSSEVSPERSPHPPPHNADIDKKRTVNFPTNLLSLPQRLENMIAEQQRRLDHAVVDTTGRHSPTRASQSAPHLPSSSNDIRGRRDTAAELQGQLPWAYIPASAHRMRDQLPPDEDLPPVPLPDYTALSSVRKASVHRANSSLSSLTHIRDYKTQTSRPPLTETDVLY
ncbi:uncharacterized protein LOC113227174 isoform X3 [Hyposmocoma kahamanoa]|uniref:uncharacterized protein LOC113227174 isoform X3 n=1 Tax=Hyposmocoma kahamanoa TaxID=1477025 RepID=UPI000E6D966B|nr:uncharacterized protein LOC113227174 isoform X3 [Hyposmocoma kahamanoa]